MLLGWDDQERHSYATKCAMRLQQKTCLESIRADVADSSRSAALAINAAENTLGLWRKMTRPQG